MHTLQNYKLNKTKYVCQCGRQSPIGMPLMILNGKNWLVKVRRTCAEFTKMVCRICKLHVFLILLWCRILTTQVMHLISPRLHVLCQSFNFTDLCSCVIAADHQSMFFQSFLFLSFLYNFTSSSSSEAFEPLEPLKMHPAYAVWETSG